MKVSHAGKTLTVFAMGLIQVIKLFCRIKSNVHEQLKDGSTDSSIASYLLGLKAVKLEKPGCAQGSPPGLKGRRETGGIP